MIGHARVAGHPRAFVGTPGGHSQGTTPVVGGGKARSRETKIHMGSIESSDKAQVGLGRVSEGVRKGRKVQGLRYGRT